MRERDYRYDEDGRFGGEAAEDRRLRGETSGERRWDSDYEDYMRERPIRSRRWRDAEGSRWAGDRGYGWQPNRGGVFEGGIGRGGMPDDWRRDASPGGAMYGYGRSGMDYPERDSEWDGDYREWRQQQVGELDADYRAFRRQKFADEFGKWREGRSGHSGNLSSGGTTKD